MSEYDDYFDSIDDDILEDLNALETSHQTNSATSKPSSTKKPVKGAPKKPETPHTDTDSAFDDFSFDTEELKRVEDAAMKQANAQAGPSRWIEPVGNMNTSKQINLHGNFVRSQSPQRQVQHRPAFGQKLQKTKVWDQTAFAKTGWKSTKPPKDRRSRSKNKSSGDNALEEDEDYVDLEGLPEPFMPFPYDLYIKLSMKEWIFPLNNPKRDYQYNIVNHSLFENCLVAIPTGVGKTFIAGCVMLNYYRWFPDGKIVFVAPTKPLVAQQIEACHQSCGIPGYDAMELTGLIASEKRAGYWKTKRVFYMTPQTLINDLAYRICDPEDIVLLVVDEAHRGTGDYAYAQIVRYMMATNPFFRLLALTATPGSKPEAVQAIVDSLHISHIEIRNEGSMDVQPYMHKRTTTQHIIEIAGDMLKIREPLLKLMEGILRPLRNAGILWYQDPLLVKDYSCTMKMSELDRSQNWAFVSLKNLGALARILGYLMEFSVGMAYHSLQDLAEGKKKDPKKNAKPEPNKIAKDPNFIATLNEIENQKKVKGTFPTHPKMEKLRSLAIQHFAGAEMEEEAKARPGIKPAESTTKMIVFCTYRECVDEIVEMLNEQQPMIRPHRFIGQGTDKRGGKGVSQKLQLEVIKDFKSGRHNVLVSTSIGEEGLDIGEVDIIVCYDSQKAAIRMVQRVGRTGRKKDGKVEALLTKGREEGNWAAALGSYKEVQQSIVRGTDLELYGDVKRLLPEDVHPQCIETVMEIIPYERKEQKRKGSGAQTRLTSFKTSKGKEKRSRKQDRIVEQEEEGEEMGVEDSPNKKKRKFVDSDSDEDSPPKKRASSTRAAAVKSAVPSLQGGFRSARDLVADPTPSSDEDSPAVTSKKKPHGAGVSAKNKGSGSISISQPKLPSTKALKPMQSKKSEEKKILSWLTDSDSDSHLVSKAKPLSSRVVDKPIELEDDSDVEVIGDTQPSPKRFFNAPAQSKHNPVQLPSSSPNPSPLIVKAPRQRSTNISTPESFQGSSPILQRLRRKSENQSKQLMPPPPIPKKNTLAAQNSTSSKVSTTSRKEKRSIFDRNELLEIEAIHSGDEVDAGSSDGEGAANSSDLEFLVDKSGTQPSSDYDQDAVYRQGLFTQVPNGGPQFAAKPTRTGYLGRGRNIQIGPNQASSSPTRDEDLDQYSVGSFVVSDDDNILLGGSSEP